MYQSKDFARLRPLSLHLPSSKATICSHKLHYIIIELLSLPCIHEVAYAHYRHVIALYSMQAKTSAALPETALWWRTASGELVPADWYMHGSLYVSVCLSTCLHLLNVMLISFYNFMLIHYCHYMCLFLQLLHNVCNATATFKLLYLCCVCIGLRCHHS